PTRRSSDLGMRTLLQVLLLAVLLVATAFGQSRPAATAQATAKTFTAQERSHLAECRRHLAAIGRALKAYRRDHRGSSPMKLIDLVPRYLLDRDLLRCPAATVLGVAFANGPPEATTETETSYMYGRSGSSPQELL